MAPSLVQMPTRTRFGAVALAQWWMTGLVVCGLFGWLGQTELAAQPAPANPPAANPPAAEPPVQTHRAGWVRVPSYASPGQLDLALRQLRAFRDQGLELVFIEVDGGPGPGPWPRELVTGIQQLGGPKTVAYVPRQAVGRQALVALACAELIVEPSARLGEIWQGRRPPTPAEQGEIREYLAPLIDRGNRPAGLLLAMALPGQQVYSMQLRKTGDVRYLTLEDRDQLGGEALWQAGPLVPELRDGKLLEVEGQRAVELGLATAEVQNREQLLQRYGVTELIQPPESWTQTLVRVLNQPVVTGLLFFIGILCLCLEFQITGFGLFGVTSGLCFALFFWSRYLGGTAGILEVTLFLLGLSLLALEICVIPGFGVPGVSGLLLILAAIVLAGQNSIVPVTREDFQVLSTTLGTLVVAGIVSIAAMLVISRNLQTSPIMNRMLLAPPVAGDANHPGDPAAELGPVLTVGMRGMTVSPLRPAGMARFDGTQVEVFADGSLIPAHCTVEVVERNGRRIIVRHVQKDEQPA